MKRGREELVLYDFQKEGIQRITSILQNSIFRTANGDYKHGKCALLYDQMGMGKTIQTLSLLLNGDFDVKNVLVVCPKTLIRVWKEEIEKYFKAHVIEFNHTKTFPQLKTNNNIVLASYDTISGCWDRYIENRLDSGKLSNEELQRFIQTNPGNPNKGLLKKLKYFLDNNYTDIALRQQLLNLVSMVNFKRTSKKLTLSCDIPFTTHWSFCVMDEAQHFKSPTSKIALSIGFLRSDYRIALTGTPIMNTGNDLLTILKFGLGMFDLDWEHILNNPSGSYCQEILDKFTFGRQKEHVAELREILPVRQKDDERVKLDWTNQTQVMVYRQAKLEAKEMFRKMKQDKSLQMSFFQRLRTLQQVALHWELPNYYIPEDDRKSPLPEKIEPSPKMLEVKRILDQYPNDKMICFCSFKQFLSHVMQPWLKSVGIKSLVFCGSSQKEQDRVLKEFHDNSKKRVLLIVKKAGSEGLNLQKAANLCVIMDPHWNKAGDEQASQRIDRIGQEKEVIVRKLFMKGSIDEALMIMQDTKEKDNLAWMNKGVRKSLETQGLFLEKYDNV